MRAVVDSNVVIAGALRDGVTRRLLIEAPIELLGPESLLSELKRHHATIASRAGLPAPEFDLLLALLTARVNILPVSEYADHMHEAERRMASRDPGDVPFLALALAARCGVWTYNRKHFEGTGVDVWSTADIATWARSSGSR